jgi:sigma-B regulation protein RsbU (phosphoserine phosphatase)
VVEAGNAALKSVSTVATVYVVDPEQRMLTPLVSNAADPQISEELIDGSLAGRVFMTVRAKAGLDGGSRRRLWCPVVNGTERLGVMAFTLPVEVDPDDPDWSTTAGQHTVP